jgi:hypothetical protein
MDSFLNYFSVILVSDTAVVWNLPKDYVVFNYKIDLKFRTNVRPDSIRTSYALGSVTLTELIVTSSEKTYLQESSL